MSEYLSLLVELYRQITTLFLKRARRCSGAILTGRVIIFHIRSWGAFAIGEEQVV